MVDAEFGVARWRIDLRRLVLAGVRSFLSGAEPEVRRQSRPLVSYDGKHYSGSEIGHLTRSGPVDETRCVNFGVRAARERNAEIDCSREDSERASPGASEGETQRAEETGRRKWNIDELTSFGSKMQIAFFI